MKDLGSLSFFLGVGASCNASGPFLSKKSFTRDILTCADMDVSNPCNTPTDKKAKLSLDDKPVVAPTLYCSLVGALQYLTLTRPDVAFAVHQVCLIMHDPREPDLHGLKRILRYM